MTKHLLLTILIITYSIKRVINQKCVCVPYYQCSEDLGKILSDGDDLLDGRELKDQCKGYFDVCCDITKLPNVTTSQPPELKGCGYRKPKHYPWLANLIYQRDIASRPISRCGVSFIHKQVVLTAAHCFHNTGLWTIQKDDISINVQNIIAHPKFRLSTLHNDIALVILDQPFEIIKNEDLICIPPPGFYSRSTRCLVGSFEKPSKFDADELNIVKLIDLPLVNKDKCLESLRKTRLGRFFQLHQSFICAGGEHNKDTCNGDGGSPLVCPISDQPGRYHQMGMVSWGIGCGEHNTPGVYVNVAIFRDWIDTIMIENNFDITGYRY